MDPHRGGSGTHHTDSDSQAAAFDRRRFLVLAGGAVAYTVLRPHLSWAGHVPSDLLTLQPWSLPAEAGGSPVEIARTLIGAAVLAPSHWNTQPWRFESEGASIRVVADTQRSLPVLDPDQRSLTISLGAALENLLIAARAYGLRPTVTYFPQDRAGRVVAEVTWVGGDSRRDRAMFAAIPERRTNRREYDGRGIFLQNRAQLTAQIPEGLNLHWMDGRAALSRLADLAHDAVHARVQDARAQAEQFSWMRFGQDEARRRGDGISVDSLEFGGPARWLAGRYFNPHSWLLRFGAQSAAKQTHSAVKSSGAVALLTTPRGIDSQWLAAGQAYERFALKATTLGIAHQPINEPIETDLTRAEILRRFGAGGEQPLMLVRLGHAKQPPTSMRRSVAVVASFRTS
jgi:nitroreductase